MLYDELVFEDGFVEVDITDTWWTQIWHPPESATEERLAIANRPVKPGAEGFFALGASADDMRVAIPGSWRRHYVAELMYSVVSRFAEYNDGWAQIAFTGRLDAKDFDPHSPTRSRLALSDAQLLPELRGADRWLREFVVKAFDRDSALAEEVDATFNVSPLFQPVLTKRRPESGRSNAEGVLKYMFPDVSDLPWERVMEFREHPAAAEARERLHEVTTRALEDGIGAADNQITRDMMFAEKELRKRYSGSERTARIIASIVPVPGNLLSEGVTAVVESARRKRDWVAALTLLRR